MRAIALIAVVAGLLAAPEHVVAQGSLDTTSTPVAGVLADTLAAGPDGSLWSVNQAANSISRVTFPDLHPSTYPVPTAAAGLAGIAAGPDGNMWFTESTSRQIGRITPSGTVFEFPIPSSAASPQRIFPGPNGALWSFNACFASGCSRFLVTTTAGASIEVVLDVPNAASFSPAHCTLGADGNVWCIGSESTQSPFSSHFTAARITPSGGYTAFVPATATQGSAIVSAPDGNVWYAWELPGGSTGVARVSPSGVITEYPIPTGNVHSWIFGLGAGSDGNLYFADRQTSVLYELILATATDAGTAALASGTIVIDIPEDLVPVSETIGASGIRAQGTPQTQAHCPAPGFVVRSGGSAFDGIVWVKVAAPTECTDMRVAGEVLRTGKKLASCSVKPQPAGSDLPDAAQSPTLTIEGPDQLTVVENVGWTECSPQTGKSIQCSAAVMQPGETFTAGFGFAAPVLFDQLITVTCASATPEIFTGDNSGSLDAFIGVFHTTPAPADVAKRGPK